MFPESDRPGEMLSAAVERRTLRDAEANQSEAGYAFGIHLRRVQDHGMQTHATRGHIYTHRSVLSPLTYWHYLGGNVSKSSLVLWVG